MAGILALTEYDLRHEAATRIALHAQLSVLEMCLMFHYSSPEMAIYYIAMRGSDLVYKLG